MTVSTNALYEKARRGLTEGDAGYWKAAEAMAQLVDNGQTLRAIAAELGCSHMQVSFYTKVWSVNRGLRHKPPFSEAMALIRGDRNEGTRIPKAPEKRAELAAELLKDKKVYEQPVVRKQVDRHVDRELRQAVAAANRAANVPTRTQQERGRRQTETMNRTFWRDLLYAIERADRAGAEAVGELARTGLPAAQSGEIIKAARHLSKTMERLDAAVQKRAIGSPMKRGA